MKIVIELSDLEVHALSFVMGDPQEWAENAIRNRARIAIEDLVQRETARMLADPNVTTIPATAEEIVLAAEVPANDSPPADVQS